MREVHSAAGGIHHQQRQQCHVGPHLQLHTQLTLTGKLHRGEEKPLSLNASMSILLSLILTMCMSCFNGRRWIVKDTTLPLSSFKHMKSQSTMPLCPLNMHDDTAWLQPHSKTFMHKIIQEETLAKTAIIKKLHLWIFKEASTRTTESGLVHVKMPLRDCFSSLKMKPMLDITLLTSVLCLAA